MVTAPGFYNNNGPYMTTSNCLMPIYPDMRTCFTDPKRLKKISSEMAKLINSKHLKCNLIIGGATAGIPLGLKVAEILNKPFCYVRKDKKPGGMSKAVEGYFKKGQTAILIDDAAAHGASKSKFVKNIREAGLVIKDVVVMLTRNYNNKDDQAWIKKSKVKLHDFGDLNELQTYAYKHGIISKEAKQLLYWYFENPHNWQKDKTKWLYFLNYLKNRKNIKSQSGV